MKRSVQEVVELVVFALIALLVGTGVVWLVGWILGLTGTLLTWLAGLVWSLLRFLVPIALVAGAVYLLVRLMNRSASKVARESQPQPATPPSPQTAAREAEAARSGVDASTAAAASTAAGTAASATSSEPDSGSTPDANAAANAASDMSDRDEVSRPAAGSWQDDGGRVDTVEDAPGEAWDEASDQADDDATAGDATDDDADDDEHRRT